MIPVGDQYLACWTCLPCSSRLPGNDMPVPKHVEVDTSKNCILWFVFYFIFKCIYWLIYCRQTLHMYRDIEARSYNLCCSTEATSVTYAVCISSLRHPVHNAHTPYCQLWPARLYKIFPHYLIKGTIFEKKITHEMCLDFLNNFSSETIFILRRTEGDMIINWKWSSCKVRVILVWF